MIYKTHKRNQWYFPTFSYNKLRKLLFFYSVINYKF